jgi:hypothetical protein
MIKGIINRNFGKISDAEFETQGLHIYNKMKLNALFPDLQDRLLVTKENLDKYSVDLAASRGLGRQLVAEKNKSRFILTEDLKQLALLIMTQTNDAAELLTTGFPLRKKPESSQLSSPGNVTLSTGLNSGEVNAFVNRPKGTISFLHQISDASSTEEHVWKTTGSTSNKHVFTNLQRGKLYAVRIAAIGSKGQIAYSSIATIYAQ